MEDSESDWDFWENLDMYPEISQEPKVKPPKSRRKTMVTPKPLTDIDCAPIQSSWEKEKREKTVERISLANQEYLKNIRIRVRSQTKKELKTAVTDLHSEFRVQISKIEQEHDKLKEKFTVTNRELFTLSKLNIDQSDIIKGFHIKNPQYSQPCEETSEKELKDLSELVDVHQLQLELIQDVTSEYSQEAHDTKRQVKQLREDIEQAHLTNQLRLQRISEMMIINEQENEAEQEICLKQSVFQEKSKYTDKTRQEIEIRKVLELRQLKFIENLQNEIKNAKFVLQNPQIRAKAQRKLMGIDSNNKKASSAAAVRKEQEPKLRPQSSGRTNFLSDHGRSFRALSFNQIFTPSSRIIHARPSDFKLKTKTSYLI